MVSTLCAILALGQQPLPPSAWKVPEWVPTVIGNLKKEGLLVGYPDGLGYRRIEGANRYEYAVATHATYRYLQDSVGALRDELTSSRFRPSKPDQFTKAVIEDLALMSAWNPLVKDIERLAVEFTPELLELEVPKGFAEEVRQLKVSLAKLLSSSKPFADVPSNHWAAEATNTLKRAGVLVGYPSGKFGG